jgi:hypothetical protein
MKTQTLTFGRNHYSVIFVVVVAIQKASNPYEEKHFQI